jgi:hypothetical protein
VAAGKAVFREAETRSRSSRRRTGASPSTSRSSLAYGFKVSLGGKPMFGAKLDE